jgi:Na+/melibiose symporter-like transporter
MRAFSGYLASNQLLALWDRILAYDSLKILAGISIIFFLFVRKCSFYFIILVLAAALFVLRKENVVKETNETAIEVIKVSFQTLSFYLYIINLGNIFRYIIN